MGRRRVKSKQYAKSTATGFEQLHYGLIFYTMNSTGLKVEP